MFHEQRTRSQSGVRAQDEALVKRRQQANSEEVRHAAVIAESRALLLSVTSVFTQSAAQHDGTKAKPVQPTKAEHAKHLVYRQWIASRSGDVCEVHIPGGISHCKPV